MLISKPYLSKTADEQLQFITSDSGFYIYKDGRYYENVIAPISIQLDSYIETNIALPSKKLNKEEVYNIIFKNAILTQEQTLNFYNTVLNTFKNLSDETVINFKYIFPEWINGNNYKEKDKIVYQNNLYEVIQNHTANIDLLPNTASSFYRKIKIGINQILEWELKDYGLGDRVKYGEHIFESLIDNNIWSPENFPSAWKMLQ